MSSHHSERLASQYAASLPYWFDMEVGALMQELGKDPITLRLIARLAAQAGRTYKNALPGETRSERALRRLLPVIASRWRLTPPRPGASATQQLSRRAATLARQHRVLHGRRRVLTRLNQDWQLPWQEAKQRFLREILLEVIAELTDPRPVRFGDRWEVGPRGKKQQIAPMAWWTSRTLQGRVLLAYRVCRDVLTKADRQLDDYREQDPRYAPRRRKTSRDALDHATKSFDADRQHSDHVASAQAGAEERHDGWLAHQLEVDRDRELEGGLKPSARRTVRLMRWKLWTGAEREDLDHAKAEFAARGWPAPTAGDQRIGRRALEARLRRMALTPMGAALLRAALRPP